VSKISLNKAGIKASFRRLCFCCLFFFLLHSGLQAQKISKYYSSSIQENGILYFIEGREGFKTDKKDKFLYDLTYLSTNDSLTLNFTIYNAEVLRVEQMELKGSSIHTSSPVSKIFVKDDGKGWEHRYTSTFSFKDLQEFYSSETAMFIIQTKKHGQILLQPKARKWKKQASIFSRIFQMIVANRVED